MFSRFRVVAAFALVVVAGVGCGSSGGGSVGPGALAGGSSSASTTPAPTASPPASTSASADDLPSEALLRSALLTAKEAGANFSVGTSSNSSDSGSVSGCPTLANLINKPDTPTAGTRQVDIGLVADGNTANPLYLTEGLIAESGQLFASDYAGFRNALATCASLTFPVDPSTNLTLNLSPINFAPSSTGARLDGELNGTTFNGYLVLSSPHDNVALLFFFFQAGGGSSQFASSLYEQAQAKATATLK